MSMLTDYTAAQLADALDTMDGFPHNTEGLSVLDEATLAFGWRYDEIAPLQRAFADARHAHTRSYCSETGNYSDEAWTKAMTAAHALAAALRELGPVKVARCGWRELVNAQARRLGWAGSVHGPGSPPAGSNQRRKLDTPTVISAQSSTREASWQ